MEAGPTVEDGRRTSETASVSDSGAQQLTDPASEQLAVALKLLGPIDSQVSRLQLHHYA
jgi:hypothetical protein